jgi:hypothetical protein
MLMHGIIQSATLEENPPDSGNIEIVLRVQGVGRGQPRTLVIPYRLLLADEALDADAMQGRAFEAEVEEEGQRRWVVDRIAFASRVLRPPDHE